MKLESDTQTAFRAGGDRVPALLGQFGPDGRTERRKRWDTGCAQGKGAQDFPDVERAIFDALGGSGWKQAGRSADRSKCQLICSE